MLPRALYFATSMAQAQGGKLPDTVVDATIAALREKLAALEQAPRLEQRKLVTVLFANLAGWIATVPSSSLSIHHSSSPHA